MMSVWKWISVWFLVLPMTGCASLTDFHYEQTQRSRARTAWRDHGKGVCVNGYAKDYECGWKDGFYDVATGGKGCPPLVAPCKYWKPSQILEDCDRGRNAYYNGFQDGVACALRYPQTHYLKLWTSCECPGPKCENQCGPACGCYNSVEGSVDMMLGGMGYADAEVQAIASEGMMEVGGEASGIESETVPSAKVTESKAADQKRKASLEVIPQGKSEKAMGSGMPQRPEPLPSDASFLPYDDESSELGFDLQSNTLGSVREAEPINLGVGLGSTAADKGFVATGSYQMITDDSSVVPAKATSPQN